LIRRAYLDLLGLPPSSEDVAAFLEDRSADFWPRLIDRLLASPHYGERWARHWLDVARFAESSGFEHDYDREGAFHYRDFVIKALISDLPYDQFVRWQLAGDEFEQRIRLRSRPRGSWERVYFRRKSRPTKSSARATMPWTTCFRRPARPFLG
jgi:hypothetical protein